jgi:hypothetical protein
MVSVEQKEYERTSFSAKKNSKKRNSEKKFQRRSMTAKNKIALTLTFTSSSCFAELYFGQNLFAHLYSLKNFAQKPFA